MVKPDTDSLLGVCGGLVALLKESKREHEHCDDCWYCCRACRHPEHQLVDGEHLGAGYVRVDPGECTCGAAEWNAKVDRATREVPET